MDWANTTFAEALEMVAERRLFAELRKEAASLDRAQDARQSLGVLGVDENAINSTLAKLRSGSLSGSQASSAMRSHVPGARMQLSNLGSAINVAGRQGRPSDVLAQADVLGLKNVVPGSESFDPATLVSSLALGAGAAAGGRHTAENRKLWSLLYGKGKDEIEAMKTQLPGGSVKPVKGKAPKGVADLWERWRQSPAAASESAGSIYRPTGKVKTDLASAARRLGQRAGVLGPPEHIPLKTTTKGKVIGITRDQLLAARKRLPTATAGRMAALGLPLAAAALPMLGREWLGGGYRSGRKPIQQLVDANQPGER